MTEHGPTTTPTTDHVAFAHVGRSSYPGILVLFTAVLMISNICATKGIAFFESAEFSLGPLQILPIITDGGFFLFPLAYILGDVLSEVYGFRAARKAIFVAFAMQAVASLAMWIAAELPPADFYPNQAAFEAVVKPFFQLVIAGLAGFIVGQTVNAWIVVRIKAITKERHLWARLIGSTVLGEFADTLVFCSIAAAAIGISTLDDFLTYLALGWIYKTVVEVLVLPVTYRVIGFVKRREPTYRPAV